MDSSASPSPEDKSSSLPFDGKSWLTCRLLGSSRGAVGGASGAGSTGRPGESNSDEVGIWRIGKVWGVSRTGGASGVGGVFSVSSIGGADKVCGVGEVNGVGGIDKNLSFLHYSNVGDKGIQQPVVLECMIDTSPHGRWLMPQTAFVGALKVNNPW
ncbi:hypothetical protein BC936DRAFT_147924 [Jimgerdemannia flammicorona]|uniref:Uncharacterized protein n=1 Tax=Jimgerdemannia flammicorona TaxID=994334 RepID=A0A433D451_9FUNG|nr:hypothetical protein BC936DRAFT_147924 [Jimgerdemannia flammicorona]